jgi:hypothetical protein
MRARRWSWPVLAVALLALSTWLMSRSNPTESRPRAKEVSLPRHMNSASLQRARARRVLPPLPPPPDSPPPQTDEPPPRRDPVLSALPPAPKEGLLIIEANALRHSPVGELLIDCFAPGGGMRELKEKLGLDPLEQLDRVAVSEELVVLSGHFGDADWSKLTHGESEPYGTSGRLYRNLTHDGRPGVALAVWGDQLALSGSEEEVRAAIDRVEGRGEVGAPPLRESDTYGEAYGYFEGKVMADLLRSGSPELAQKLAQAAQRVYLHLDAREGVGLVADVEGPPSEALRDLGKSLGAALALSRFRAKAQGQAELADLLELAKVVPQDGTFRLELAVPLQYVQEQLKDCPGRLSR